MSLFPAYSVDDENVKDIVEIPQINRPKSWLSNESFVPKIAVAPIVEENDIKPSEDDLEIIYEKSDSSSIVSDKKRRKKRKREKKKSEKIKKLKYDDKPKHEKIDSIFLQSDPRIPSSSSSKTNLYAYDLKRDIENLHFGTVYKKQRPIFNLKMKYCLGGNERVNSLMFAEDAEKKKRKLKETRYFNRKLQRFAPDPLQILPRKQSENAKNFESNFGEDFLPIESEIEINDEKLIYDSKIQMYRPVSSSVPSTSNEPLPFADDVEISLDDLEIARENKRFNKILTENPNDIELWKKFLDFQDSFYEINARRDNVKLTKLALLERKLAILDKAMQQNSNSFELKLIRMDLGLEAGWDREKLKDEWKKLEFTHINQPAVWIGRLKFAYSHFSHFTVGRQSSLFDHCLDKLSVVLKNQLVTHPCLPHTEDFFVSCLVAKIDLWKNSGHYEKAIALFQALIEFNFRQPEILKSSSTVEKRKFFEPFWDANCPRLGENGALGWSQVMQNKTSTEPENTSNDDDLDRKEEEIYSNESKNVAQIWFEIENLRQSYHWKPFRGVDEPEDSERIVLLDDIENSLYEIVEPHNRFFLILKSLRVLGVRLPSLFSSNTAVWFDDDDTEEGFEIFENLPKLNKFASNFRGFEEFVTNLFDQIVKFLDDRFHKLYLICVRIFHFASNLASNGDVSSKEKLKIFTKFAKEILSREECRSEIVVYGAYADGLCKLGFVNEAINVLQTTLHNIKTNVFSLPTNSFAQIIHLNLFNLYVFCRLNTLTDVKNQSDLVKSLSIFVIHGFLSKDDDGEEINVVRVKKTFSDLIVNLECKFSSDANSLVVAWLGDSLSLTTNLYSIYLYCLTKKIEKCIEMFASCRNFLTASRNFYAKNDLPYLALDRNVERSFVNEIRLVNFHIKNSFGPPKILSDCIARCLEKYPANGSFLKIYCDINIRVQLISKLRRFFSSPLTKRTIWWIAAVYAEFLFYLKIKENNDFCETHKLKNVFETALETCRDSSVLWRLYVKMAPHWSDDEFVKKIFYQAIRQCPNSKDLYMEGINLFPGEVQTFVDLMTEKELRVRLPWEELNLLIESSKKVPNENETDDV